MGNRCPSCNKFGALQTEVEDPDDFEFDPDSDTVRGSVRVYRSTECCHEEMTEATFDVDVSVDCDDKKRKDSDEYEVVIDNIEVTESGGARYKKNMVGYSVSGHVLRKRTGRRKNAKPVELEIGKFDASDDMAASHFDELQ